MDSRICQTPTVSPAESGDFPLLFNADLAAIAFEQVAKLLVRDLAGAESSRNRVSPCAAQAWASHLVAKVADARAPLMHTSARQPPFRFLNVAMSDSLRFTPMA